MRSLVCILACVSLLGCTADPPVSREATSARPRMPADEAAFLIIPLQAAHAVQAAPNDIIGNRLQEAWTQTYCNALGQISMFQDWNGEIMEIEATGEFKVNLGSGSDIFFEQTVPLDSAVLNSISKLRNGQKVVISGHVEPEAVDSECHMGWVGGDTAVRFTAVRPA